jgi:hypothetical protein
MEKTKKVVAVAFIAVLATLTVFGELSETLAEYRHSTANNPGYPGPDYFTMCCHNLAPPWSGSYYDVWTATGVGAYYNIDNQPPGVSYAYGYWDHLCGTGGYFPQIGPMECIFCVNYYSRQYIYDYSTPEWGYIDPYYGYFRHYTYNSTRFDPDVNSVEGATGQFFCDPQDPFLYGFVQTYTDPWDILTAYSS